jgi:hypothetical protein
MKDKLEVFKSFKENNPTGLFGSSDKPFASDGLFQQKMKGMKHAHLTHDISIVYRMYGSNPNIIELYGIFTHDEIGTGGNRKKQGNMAKQFSNQLF